MKSPKFFMLMFIVGFFPALVSALEIDEKLTLRILSVSESKKTVLIKEDSSMTINMPI